jgi:two-component system OmpR family response regulator
MTEGRQSRPQRLLVVDDDRALARTIKIYLEEAGYGVEVAPDAAAARKHLAQQSFDMAIVDLGLPGEDGLSLTRSLREQGEIGLLILTGRQDATDRIVGLEIGADDYVLKPVELRELLARVRSILRRSGRGNGGVRKGIASKLLRFGDWTADLASRALLRGDGDRVELTTAEFDLLCGLPDPSAARPDPRSDPRSDTRPRGGAVRSQRRRDGRPPAQEDRG